MPVSYGWALVAAFGLTYLATPIVFALVSLGAYRFLAVLRQALIEATYRKALLIHVSVAQETGMGSLTSYISLDIERIV